MAALIGFSMTRGQRYRVEVCMSFGGRDNCRTVAARSESGAIRSGMQNACGDLTSGVTEVMKCEGSEPKSVRWLTRPEGK